MRFSISEIAKLANVTVRTLHYYDEINLLSPTEIAPDTGYRYYDELAIERLQQILFYRELDFPLKEIIKIMNSSNYNKERALMGQRELLNLKKKRLEDLIHLLDASLKGENTMSFEEFDRNEIERTKEKYREEVEQKWGGTDAYKQSKERTDSYKKEDWTAMMEESDRIMKLFSERLGENPCSEEVQKLVRLWQQYITEYYYDCTKEILSGLGEMYTVDLRFTENIDKFRKGTAQFMGEAIKEYCKK